MKYIHQENDMKVLGITGHRPKKLYGYDDSHPGNLFIINAMGKFFEEYRPDKVITGMALGTDTWAAQWCIKMGIPFLAAIPTENQDIMWPLASQEKYKFLLTKAAETVLITPEIQGISISLPEAMQKRNEYMVDNSDSMLAIFGGSPSGTKNCLKYAKEKGKRIDIINPGDYYKHA